MGGLECNEKLFSMADKNKDFRIDSQFYTTVLKYNCNLKYIPIGDVLINTQYGVSKSMNNNKDGYQIFRMNEIHNSLCDLMSDKYIELSPDEFDKVKLNDGDVLFNRTNSYELVGRTGIYYFCGTPQTFASYLVRLVPDNKNVLSEYLAAFLSSKYGKDEIKRRARQSINQTNVNPEEVKAVMIPLLSESLQIKIKSCFKNAHLMRLNADKQYKDAEIILENAISFNNVRTENISIKSLSNTLLKSFRIDAEYYQPKYEDYTSALSTKETVRSLCKLYDFNYLPNESAKYQYIELSNVGVSGEIIGVETQNGYDLPTRARRIVKSGQVIISSVEGSLQSCALITDEYNGALCSTGFYILDSAEINSETLLVLFKSKPIQALLKQRCSGTILTAISKDELLSMPLPMINKNRAPLKTS